jgi:acetone monooxygenase
MSEYKTNGARKHESLDAVVIGTGVAGLYQLYKLRDEQGLKVKAVDTATGVGGTWYWNRYPGARFDSEAYIYQYLFSEELYKGWSWSERFPGQPEIERWLNYVADELDLRKDIRFGTTITSAVFNEATQRHRCFLDRRRSRGAWSTPRAGRRRTSISPESASASSATAPRASR